MLTRAWGRRGEIAAVSFSRGADRFQSVRELYLFPPDGGIPRRMQVESVWEHRAGLIFKFAGVDSISDAELLARHEVRVPLAERAPLPEGEYYLADLVGCEMVEAGGGARIGIVRGWQECGGPALLEVEVEQGGEPLLVPFARAICTVIDPAARRIEAALPAGLRDVCGPDAKPVRSAQPAGERREV